MRPLEIERDSNFNVQRSSYSQQFVRVDLPPPIPEPFEINSIGVGIGIGASDIVVGGTSIAKAELREQNEARRRLEGMTSPTLKRNRKYAS